MGPFSPLPSPSDSQRPGRFGPALVDAPPCPQPRAAQTPGQRGQEPPWGLVASAVWGEATSQGPPSRVHDAEMPFCPLPSCLCQTAGAGGWYWHPQVQFGQTRAAAPDPSSPGPRLRPLLPTNRPAQAQSPRKQDPETQKALGAPRGAGTGSPATGLRPGAPGILGAPPPPSPPNPGQGGGLGAPPLSLANTHVSLSQSVSSATPTCPGSRGFLVAADWPSVFLPHSPSSNVTRFPLSDGT